MTVTITFRSQRPPGGQHTNGPEYPIICAKDELTGVYVEVPSDTLRSAHKARIVALEAIEWITGIKP